MAALPPPRARARHLLLATLAAAAVGGGLGYLVHVWPAPEPLPTLRAEPDVALYPITRVPIGEDPRCMLFLEPLLRHPSWQITIMRGAEDGCGNSTLIDDSYERVTVDSTGRATLSARGGETRTLFLPPTLLARLHGVAGAACHGPREWVEDDITHVDTRFVAVWWGEVEWRRARLDTVTAVPGVATFAGSPAYAELAAFLDAARIHRVE
jgi:hypothetical protein